MPHSHWYDSSVNIKSQAGKGLETMHQSSVWRRKNEALAGGVAFLTGV